MKIKFLFPLLMGFILLVSCKRSSDKPLWNVDLLTPLVQSSLTIADLIKDTSHIKTNSDNSITIVNRQRLATINLDSLVSLNTTPFTKTVTLDSLVLDTKSDTTTLTIGSIADSLINSGDSYNQSIGNGIKLAAAFHLPVDFSTIPVLSFLNNKIDASGFFQNADVATGSLKVKIVNTLPADIQNLAFDLSNKVNGDLILSHTFTNIPGLGGKDSAVQDLAGKQIEGILNGSLTSLQFDGSSNSYITLDMGIQVIMTISGVKVNSATAVFPAQDIVQNEDESSLTGLGDVELKYAEIESGFIKVHVKSTAQDKVYFTYEIPQAFDKSGNTFKVLSSVPAAVAGTPVEVEYQYDLAGYGMDLTGKNSDTVNTFYSTLKGRIEYTGKLVYFSLADYMTVDVSAVALKPSLVRGYLGQNTVNLGPDVVSLNIFKGIESGSLNFENIKMGLVVENGFGMKANVTVNNLSTENSRTGQFYALSPLPPTLSINRSTVIGTPSVNTFDLGNNLENLINILPDKVNYFATVQTNPSGNEGYIDFATKSASLDAYLDIEMPLSIKASQLVLGDTSVFNTAALQKRNVNSGTFKVFVNNGFPLNAALKMYFLNPYGTVMDSVKSSTGAILAAPVNASYRVTEKRASQIVFDVNESMMQNLYNSTMVIFKIEFTTEPSTNYLKIYSDYSIDFKLVGDMDYSVHKK